MKVNLELSKDWQKLIDIEKVEKKYNVKFVCETPLRYKEGWRDGSSLIFYGEKHPQGSNYMAISIKYDPYSLSFSNLVISDGISATDGYLIGLVDEDEVIYSRFRHDYRVGKSGVWIDGGRDYTRSGGGEQVMLVIKDGKLEVQ